MAEIGGLFISIRQTAIPGDAADETHSLWTLELVGISGRSCTVSWRALRKWNASRVVYEYHYDHQQSGGPLTSNDLSLYPATTTTADQRPSLCPVPIRARCGVGSAQTNLDSARVNNGTTVSEGWSKYYARNESGRI